MKTTSWKVGLKTVSEVKLVLILQNAPANSQDVGLAYLNM
jgi:hypothetical protein